MVFYEYIAFIILSEQIIRGFLTHTKNYSVNHDAKNSSFHKSRGTMFTKHAFHNVQNLSPNKVTNISKLHIAFTFVK